jgi:hypothetical protein
LKLLPTKASKPSKLQNRIFFHNIPTTMKTHDSTVSPRGFVSFFIYESFKDRRVMLQIALGGMIITFIIWL